MGALDRVFRSRRPSQERPLAAIIAGLWRNNEQGVRFEASDLSTMFQDAAGTLPVYAPGQGQVDPPVGLLLDKRLGLVRGPELWVDASVTLFGEASRVSPGVYRVYTSSGAFSGVQIGGLTPGKYYELTLDVSLITAVGSGLACDVTTPAISFNTLGGKRYILRANSNVLAIKRNAAALTDIQISAVSVREVFGNHAYQVSTTSRPTLSARYNWATFTEDLTAPVWQKGSPGFSITPKATLAPDGVSLADIIVSPGSGAPILAHASTAQAPTVAVSFFVKPIANASTLSLLFRNNTTSTNYDGTILNTVNGTAGTPAWVVTPAGDGWLKVRYTRETNISVGDQISIYAGAIGGAAVPGRSWSVWGLDVRPANDGVGLPPYQSVVDANTYDTVGFPLYLRFDGVDDWLQTESVDFGNTFSVLVSAAARKLTDASTGLVVELGTNFSTTAGTFAMFYSANSGSPLASFSSRGASAAATALDNAAVAPLTAVLTGLASTVEPRCALRKNGVVVATSAAVQGGGFFGKYPLYIGRRGGTSVPFNGRLYSLYIRGGSSTAAQLSAVERHMNQQARIY